MNMTPDTQPRKIFLFNREDTRLSGEPVSQAITEKRADTALIFVDPKASGEDLDQDATTELLKGCMARLKNGGSIAVPCDLRTLTSLSKALEAAGFKQLRFIQAVSETDEQGFYPENSRTMMLMAVKGGGSTFNSIYNNGHYPRPEESNKGTPLLPASACAETYLVKEIVSVHSNPQDKIATTSSKIAQRLAGLLTDGSIEFRQKPAKPLKEPKTPAEQVA